LTDSLSSKQGVEEVLSTFLASLLQHLKTLKCFNTDLLVNCSSSEICDEKNDFPGELQDPASF